MNIAFWVLIGIAAVIMIACVRKGVKKGFIYEVNAMLTVLCATIVFQLIVGIVRQQNLAEVSSVLMGIFMLVIVMALYGIFHFIFGALQIFARLPLIRVLDNILGLAAGFVEGALTLYLFDTVLRFFVAM